MRDPVSLDIILWLDGDQMLHFPYGSLTCLESWYRLSAGSSELRVGC